LTIVEQHQHWHPTYVLVLDLKHLNIFKLVTLLDEDLLARVIDLAIVPHREFVRRLVFELFDEVFAVVQDRRVQHRLINACGLFWVAGSIPRLASISSRIGTDRDVDQCGDA
jgi:hypothetical protein